MLRRAVAVALAAAFIWPGAVSAQEEEAGPPMLMISSWKCNWSDMGSVNEDWNTRGKNAAQMAVDNSTWLNAGVFYHSWADEWNVHYWATAKDIPALLEGQDAMDAAYDEMYPDAPSQWEYCTEHKDGFYQLGQWAVAEPESPPGPAMAISSWKCTDVGAVNQGWTDYAHAKAQAVVDAGNWSEAGVFYHAWAGEWNVNFYFMADDIPAILSGWDAYVASLDEDAPDLNEWCFEHKDGFYEFGETAMGTGD